MTQDEAIKKLKSGESLKEMKEFVDNLEVVKEAIKIDWKNIKYVSERLRNNQSIAISAVSQSEKALKQLPESMQSNPEVLIKAFDVSHKIALVKPELLSDEKYLVGVLKVGSSEHKIVGMLSSQALEEHASIIYPFIEKALNKINYAYSDGFTVRELMYQIPFAKGMAKAQATVNFDYRMSQDLSQLNSDQLYSLIVITDCAQSINRQTLFNQLVQTDCVLGVEWLLEKNKITTAEIKLLTDLASKNSSPKISAYLLMKTRNKKINPREELLFLLKSRENALNEKGFKVLSDHIFDYEHDTEIIEKFVYARPPVDMIQMVFSSLTDSLMTNEDFVYKLMKINSGLFQYASMEMKSSKDFIRKLVSNPPDYILSFMRYVDVNLLQDDAFMNELIDIRPESARYASEKILSDKVKMKEVVSKCPSIYSVLNDELQSDADIYMSFLEENGDSYSSLPYHLRQSKEIFEFALKNQREPKDLLNYAGDEIKGDRDLVLKSIKNCPESIKYVSIDLRNDTEIAYLALDVERKSSKLIFNCREEFESTLDEEFTFPYNYNELEKEERRKEYLETQECALLEYVGDQLKSNREFMVPLIDMNPFLYRFACGSLKEDTDLINSVISKEPFCIKYVSKNYIKRFDSKEQAFYKQYLDPLITSAKQTVSFASYKEYTDNLSNDIKELAKQVASDPYRFKTLSADQKKNKDLQEAIVNINPYAVHGMWGISESMYLMAIEKDAGVVEELYKGMKHNEDFILKAIKRNTEVVRYALKAMTNKKGFVLKAVNKNGLALEYVADKFKADEDIVLAAIRQEPLAFQFVDVKLLKKKEVAEIIYNALDRIDYFNNPLNRQSHAQFMYNSSGEKPAKFGKKWTVDDIQTLLNDYKAGEEIDFIAKKIGRDILGCLYKLDENDLITSKDKQKIEAKYHRSDNLNVLLDVLNK